VGKREETETIFNKFLADGLELERQQVQLVDLHRLPQHPVYKSEVKVNRPIIIKVASAYDKHTIMTNLKNLKNYNERLRERDVPVLRMYISMSICLKKCTSKKDCCLMNLKEQERKN